KIGLSALSPVTASAAAQGEASIQTSITASANLAAALNVTPPSFAAMLAGQAKFYANLSALGKISSPQVTLNVTAAAAASLQANFGTSCSLGAVLASGVTFFAYSYSG